MQCHYGYCHFPNSITTLHQHQHRLHVSLFLLFFVVLFCYIFGTFQIKFFNSSSCTQAHTFHARVKWMRNVIIINSTYLILLNEKRKHTHTLTFNKKYLELIRVILYIKWQNIQAAIQGSYQFYLVDLIFYRFCFNEFTWKSKNKNLLVIAIWVHNNLSSSVLWISKICHKMDRNYYDLFCHLRNNVNFIFLHGKSISFMWQERKKYLQLIIKFEYRSNFCILFTSSIFLLSCRPKFISNVE